MYTSKRNNVVLLAILLVCFVAAPLRAGEPVRITVSSVNELYDAVIAAEGGSDLTISLEPGVYEIWPSLVNHAVQTGCDGPWDVVKVTVGLKVSGTRIRVRGASPGEVTIVTHSEFGIFFDECDDCELSGVTVTGGERDPERVSVTAAAVVARDGSVTVHDCIIAGNVGAEQTGNLPQPGIAAVCGLQDSDIHVINNEIEANTGSGIVLRYNASARIERNVIGGTWNAVDGNWPPGTTGVYLRCGARAVIEKNHIHHFNYGISVGYSAMAEVRVNFIENVRAWGIAVIEGKLYAGPNAIIDENVIYTTGATGILFSRQSPYGPGEIPGRMWRNFIVKTGQNPDYDADEAYGYQCPLSVLAAPAGFEISRTTLYGNRRAVDCGLPGDRTREWFWRARRTYVRKYRNTKIGVDGRHSFWDTAFMQRYTRF